MANAFFNFLTRFSSGTTVKAGPINDRLTEVQSGFALVETATKSALKIAGYSSSPSITATPNSLIQLNASGVPIASGTFQFSPNMGAYRVQNVGNASIGTDAPNYGQMTAYVATIAFGSPNVLTVPSFGGQALKGLRVNAGATALEFADAIPVPTSSQADYLVASGGSWIQSRSNPNLLVGGGFTLDRDATYAWVKSAAMSVFNGYDGGVYLTVYPGLTTGLLAESTLSLSPTIVPGRSYTASVSYKADTGTAEVRCYMEFFNVSNVSISSSYVALAGNNGTGVTRRYALTATAPALAARAKIYLSSPASVASSNNIEISRVKLEKSSVATPWNDDATDALLGLSASLLSVSGSGGAVANLGIPDIGSTITQTLNFMTRTAGIGAGFSLYAKNSGPDALYGGDLEMRGRSLVMPKLAGFASVFDNGNTGTAKTINWDTNGAKQKATLNGNATITLLAPDLIMVVDGLRLMLKKDATATTFTLAFASAVTIKWVGNVVPESLTIADQEMAIVFWWDASRFVGSWQKI